MSSRVTADKWALLDALTHAAPDFGLTHRSLTVLRALLSFFPDRALPHAVGAAVVYPSNRTLSERLNGMPESTLRRHLSTLVQSGLVDRQDSANRKRFARFGGVAFGFDLSPLARFAAAVMDAGRVALERRARTEALRARLAVARQALLDVDPDDALAEETRLTLRRKMTPEALQTLLDRVENRLDIPVPSAGMSDSDSENERHIQDTGDSDSVCRGMPAPSDLPALSDVLESCKEYRDYFPETPTDWPGLDRIVRRLHPMLGIDAQVYAEAQAQMGREQAATVVLCMLETLTRIQRPGAYLRGLSRRAMDGRLNLRGLLSAARRAGASGGVVQIVS